MPTAGGPTGHSWRSAVRIFRNSSLKTIYSGMSLERLQAQREKGKERCPSPMEEVCSLMRLESFLGRFRPNCSGSWKPEDTHEWAAIKNAMQTFASLRRQTANWRSNVERDRSGTICFTGLTSFRSRFLP